MLMLELSLARIVDGLVEGPSGDLWMVTWTDVLPGPDREGKFDGCAHFNGGTSKITVAGITCPTRFTLAAWVRGGPLLAFHYATIMGFGEDRPFFGLHRRRPILLNGVTADFTCPGSWTHVAVTQDESRSKLYVNGVLMASSSSVAATGGKDLGIGCDLGRGYAWFEGEMADVRIFDEALDESAIQQMMRSGPRDSARPAAEAPPPVHLPWAVHVPYLEAVHAAFPSPALGELAAMLAVGLAPPSSPSCRLETWSPHEGGSLSVDMDPFLIEVGDAPLLSLSGEEGGPAAIWLLLARRGAEGASLATARLRGKVTVLAGAVSEMIDCELFREGGLLLSLGGGSFGEGVSLTVDVVSARKCKLSLSASFDYSARIGPLRLNARVAAAMVVKVDGRSCHQHVEFCFELAGEEIRLSASPERLIVGLDGLRETFREAALSIPSRAMCHGV